MAGYRFMTFPPSSLDTPGRPLYYDVLPTGYIRLLQPVLGMFDHEHEPQLCFSLHYCALDDAPDYAALSYRWGPAEKTDRILVNKQHLTITPNLASALLDLLQHHSVSFLWVDAICINQADTAERSRQVQIMGDIFRHADLVLAYLGQEEVWTRSAFAALRPDSHDGLQATDVTGMSAIASRQRMTTDPVEPLLDVDYWTRTWIVQEFLLARELYLFSGACYASRAELASYCDKTPHDPAGLRHLRTPQQLLHGSGDPCFGYPPNGDCNLVDLLVDYAYRTHCTDVRDKIIGIIGLHNCGGPLGSYPHSLKLSYEHVARLVVQTLDHIPTYVLARLDSHRTITFWRLLRSMLDSSDLLSASFQICRMKYQYCRAYRLVSKSTWVTGAMDDIEPRHRTVCIVPYTDVVRINTARGEDVVLTSWPLGVGWPRFRYLGGCSIARRSASRKTPKHAHEPQDAPSSFPRLWSRVPLADRLCLRQSSFWHTPKVTVWNSSQEEKQFRDTKAPLPGTICPDPDCEHQPMAGDLVCVLARTSASSASGRTVVLLRKVEGACSDYGGHAYDAVAFTEWETDVEEWDLGSAAEVEVDAFGLFGGA